MNLLGVFPLLIEHGVLMILALVVLFNAVRLYLQYTCGMFKGNGMMEGKTVIITGCTGGIGKETARETAKRGARVIMACRNIEAAELIKKEIVAEASNTEVVVKYLDLSSFASIRAFADDVNSTEPNLEVLIHNAGVAQSFTKKRSENGIELTMATNHYGPFLLTHLLIGLLKKSTPSRIVVVSSLLYIVGYFNPDNPNPVNSFPGYLYCVSKEANILFTKELARRLEGTGVTANCLHPGIIKTDICRNIPKPVRRGLGLFKGFLKTPLQGCQTTVMLAVDDGLVKTTGKFFTNCRERTLLIGASAMSRARKLWEISEKIVKLKENDPRI